MGRHSRAEHRFEHVNEVKKMDMDAAVGAKERKGRTSTAGFVQRRQHPATTAGTARVNVLTAALFILCVVL